MSATVQSRSRHRSINLICSATHLNYGEREKPYAGINETLLEFGSLLIWTAGETLNTETFEGAEHGYFHTVFHEGTEMSAPVVVHPSKQPVPAPMNKVTGLQVLPVSGGAADIHVSDGLEQVALLEVTWAADADCATWSSWRFKVRCNGAVFDVKRGERRVTMAVRPDALYELAVRAESNSGSSLWSDAVRVMSTPPPLNSPKEFFWSTPGGIRGSDGTEISLQHVSHMDGEGPLLFFTNGSHVWRMNTAVSKENVDLILTLDGGIEAVAYDAYAKSVYASVPSRRLILRSRGGYRQEILPISATASELALDSPRALMCWNSRWTEIRCSSLGGEHARTAHKLSLWSEDRIAGLSIDPETHLLTFLVSSYRGDHEYKLHLFNIQEGTGEKVSVVNSLNKGRFSGPLLALNGKAHWLQNGTDLVHFDTITKQIIATQRLGEGVLAFTATQGPVIKRGNFNVIPAPVVTNDIRVSGDFPEFKVIWEPVQNVNYDSAGYGVLLEIPEANYSGQFSTSVPEFDPREHVSPPRLLTPYTEMKVSILAKTKWATAAKVAVAEILTPDDVSESPRNVRAYFWPSLNGTVFEVKWAPPASPNGAIVGYHVSVSCEGRDICGKSVTTGAGQGATKFLSASLSGAPEEELRFGVSAVNSRGKGDTAAVSITIESEYALLTPSRIIAYRPETKGLQVLDVGAKTVEVDEMYVGEEVKAAAYSELDEAFYYLSAEGALAKLSRRRPFREHLKRFSHATDLAYDFFARAAYVLKSSRQQSAVYRVAVDEYSPANDNEVIAELDGYVGQIAVDPYFASVLYFASGSDVKMWDLRAGKALPRQEGNGCNCGAIFDAANGAQVSFALKNGGRIGSVRVAIGLAAGEAGDGLAIYEADDSICKCDTLAVMNGTRASVVAADSAHVYLANNVVVDRGGRATDSGDIASAVRPIAPFNPEYQSMPEPLCLQPQAPERGVEAENITDVAMAVPLPDVAKHADCPFSNALPPTNFTVQYGEMREDVTDLPSFCRWNVGHCGSASKIDYGPGKLESVSSITLTNLKPNSRYGLLVRLSNVYHSSEADAEANSQDLARFISIVRTLEGQPSKPRNVTAEALTPTSIRVKWLPSEVKNADGVSYTVFYQTSKSVAATFTDPPLRGYVTARSAGHKSKAALPSQTLWDHSAFP